MRVVVSLSLALLGAWLVLRRRGGIEGRVVVAWADGSELEPRSGSRDRERLVAVARAALA